MLALAPAATIAAGACSTFPTYLDETYERMIKRYYCSHYYYYYYYCCMFSFFLIGSNSDRCWHVTLLRSYAKTREI